MHRPISTVGIFDSGLGGLTVVQQILHHIPSIPLIYFGDQARFPYGNKSQETIIKYAIQNTEFLLEEGADCIIIACNTATAAALTTLQNIFSVPIFGVIEPASKKAAQITKTKEIAVIGTTSTIRSKRYEEAILRYDPTITISSFACPLLVTLIEEGAPNDQIAESILAAYLNPLLKKNIDTLLLGCTHYPLIKEQIAQYCGPHINLVDPAESISSWILPLYEMKNSSTAPHISFYSSDDIEQFSIDSSRFFRSSLKNVSFKSI